MVNRKNVNALLAATGIPNQFNAIEPAFFFFVCELGTGIVERHHATTPIHTVLLFLVDAFVGFNSTSWLVILPMQISSTPKLNDLIIK